MPAPTAEELATKRKIERLKRTTAEAQEKYREKQGSSVSPLEAPPPPQPERTEIPTTGRMPNLPPTLNLPRPAPEQEEQMPEEDEFEEDQEPEMETAEQEVSQESDEEIGGESTESGADGGTEDETRRELNRERAMAAQQEPAEPGAADALESAGEISGTAAAVARTMPNHPRNATTIGKMATLIRTALAAAGAAEFIQPFDKVLGEEFVDQLLVFFTIVISIFYLLINLSPFIIVAIIGYNLFA
ncbi:hypothetical protein KKC32_01320 [Patescibacteria group bacterium]|nr:hypothetical protein [Patescibacteria group bacterium]